MNPNEQQKLALIKALALKWQEGTITEEEKLLFNQWYHSFDDLSLKEVTSEKRTQLQNRLYNSIAEREHLSPATSWFNRNSVYISGLAAVLTLVFAVYGYYFYIDKHSTNPIKQTVQQKHRILPGGNKAVLTLANGATIVLNQNPTGVVTMQGTVAVKKGKEGVLNYELTAKNKDAAENGAINTITTPRGGQYQVNLSDGTKVWLNAASSLKFPVTFNSDKREVELTGEAYFEVNPNPISASAKNRSLAKSSSAIALQHKKIPFLVKTKSQIIEVLGTHFNVNAYDDEPDSRTTLLEGSVKVKQSGKQGTALLKPGQQAVTGAKNMEVSDVDVSQAVAWQQGYFLFDNESMESIMRKISRWYDVDVEYSGNIRYRKFGGRLSKYENITEILRLMEKTQVIHFRTAGRRVIVMP